MEFISLKRALDLSPEEISRLGGFDEKIKDVAEFLSDAQEALGDLSFVEALNKAAPWVEKITDSAGDALPVIKFASSFLGKLLKEKDPEVLGRLACTLAYQQAIKQAASGLVEPHREKQVTKNVKTFLPSSEVDLKTLSLTNALSHRFVKEADRALLYYAARAWFSEIQQTRWQTGTHSFFIENLTLLLTNRETAEKFEPFRQMISMTANAQNPYAELNNHAEYQKRLFEEAKVFNTEPFALKDVYVETDCSHLTWGDISREKHPKDPFAADLPRFPLLKTVLDVIGDPNALGDFPASFSNKAGLKEVLDRYRNNFGADSPQSHLSGTMEILSLPLLAHLALRLISCSDRPVQDLVEKPTDLYRALIDMTVERRGRFGEGSESILESNGPDEDLRRKLQKTGVAITVFGKESIPSRELAIRLGLRPRELETWAQDATKNHFLTDLLVNFFFKGGNEKLGCEFLHKSFREYLFAEHVVQELKTFGLDQPSSWPERPESEYWKDFPERSNLWRLSRALGEAVSSQWLSPEVARHLTELIHWEIGRALETSSSSAEEFSDTTLSIEQWEYVREALADLWDWWGEGVHLRPPVAEDKRHVPEFHRSYVDELIELKAARDVDTQREGMLTVRTTTIDAHLGEGLFLLAMLVHYELAIKQGWAQGGSPQSHWEGASEPGEGLRRYQTTVGLKTKWVLFAPTGKNSQFFTNYQSRINSAGWRDRFPAAFELAGVDLRGITLFASDGILRLLHCNISGATIFSNFVALGSTLAKGAVFKEAPGLVRLKAFNNSDLSAAGLSAQGIVGLTTVILPAQTYPSRILGKRIFGGHLRVE